jgi:hypothetical protein
LCVATGDDDARSGVCAVNFADRFAGLRISRRCDRTRVQYHHVRLAVLADVGPAASEHLVANRYGVSFGGATSEILNGKSGHSGF